MHQLSPQETFPIVYVLGDPTDTGTYYVRSVVRNAVTGAIIRINNLNYVNLTSLGSQRFAKTIQAPNDPGGQGTWIDITTTVYTDSAYTTVSGAYVTQLDKYLVQQRLSTSTGFGGGGFSKIGVDDFSYEKLKKLLIEIIKEYVEPTQPTDLSPVMQGIKNLGLALENIDIPETQKIDLAGHAQDIVTAVTEMIIKHKPKPFDPRQLLDAIGAVPGKFPEIPKHPDYSPDLTEISTALEYIKRYIDGQKKIEDMPIDHFLKTKFSFKPTPDKTVETATRLQKLKA